MKFIKHYRGFAEYPKYIYVVVNSACNAHCKMCDIGQKNKDSTFYKNMMKGCNLDLNKFESFLVDVSRFKPTIAITSVEPLLYPKLGDLIHNIHRRGMNVLLTTNGYNWFYNSRINPNNTDYNKYLVEDLYLSIDGKRQTHVYMREVGGLFDINLDIIKDIELKKSGGFDVPNVHINYTITPLNYKDMLDSVDFFSKYDIKSITFSHQNFVTQDMAEKNMVVDSRFKSYPSCVRYMTKLDMRNMDFKWLFDTIQYIKCKYKNVGFSPDIKNVEDLKKYYLTGEFIEPYTKCNAVWNCAQVFSNGDFGVSTRCYNINLGNIYESSFEELWNGKKMREFRNLVGNKALPACSRCCGIF